MAADRWFVVNAREAQWFDRGPRGFVASFDSEGLIKRGNAYYSENWEKAGNRVSFNIDAAFGAIRIQWVEPEAQFRRAQR